MLSAARAESRGLGVAGAPIVMLPVVVSTLAALVTAALDTTGLVGVLIVATWLVHCWPSHHRHRVIADPLAACTGSAYQPAGAATVLVVLIVVPPRAPAPRPGLVIRPTPLVGRCVAVLFGFAATNDCSFSIFS
jgi:hypothetical protein